MIFGSKLERDVADERVQSSIKEMGLEKIRDKVSHRISTGERKKVALAIQPKILLIDEPRVNFDPKNSAQIL